MRLAAKTGDPHAAILLSTLQAPLAGNATSPRCEEDKAAGSAARKGKTSRPGVDKGEEGTANKKARTSPSASGMPAPVAPPQAPLRSSSMSVEDVCRALEDCGMGMHARSFRESAIDGLMLSELRELWDDPLGVSNKAHRIRIEKALGLR